MIDRVLVCTVAIGLLLGCGSDSADDPDDVDTECSGWRWPGRGDAQQGDYRCSGGSTIQVCTQDGWAAAGRCSCTVNVGDPRKPPYSTSCGDVGAPGNAACSYAGKSCLICYGVSHDGNGSYRGRGCVPL